MSSERERQDCFRRFTCILVLASSRPMLYLATSQFMDSPLRASVDIYTTIHQLFARAHSDLKLPHVRFAMRESEYVTWINSHTLSEWIALIGETLRIYEEEMNRKGAREFAPEYPVIVRLLDKASA